VTETCPETHSGPEKLSGRSRFSFSGPTRANQEPPLSPKGGAGLLLLTLPWPPVLGCASGLPLRHVLEPATVDHRSSGLPPGCPFGFSSDRPSQPG